MSNIVRFEVEKELYGIVEWLLETANYNEGGEFAKECLKRAAYLKMLAENFQFVPVDGPKISTLKRMESPFKMEGNRNDQQKTQTY